MSSKTPSDRLMQRLRVPPGGPFKLADINPEDCNGIPGKEEARDALKKHRKQLDALQEVLYAQSQHAVLVVLQGMDTAGKDGTIRRVFGPLNPQGVRVTSFKAPTALELSHDFLWRIHAAVPPRGFIGIFNRSHYEDVLVARVHGLVGPEVIKQRYEQINRFEAHLAANGVHIVKFFLHVSRAEQKERLQARLDRPDKHWKFNRKDLAERQLWDDYQQAYEKALVRCSTPQAPWYVIPADKKWYRDLVVSRIMVSLLQGLDLTYPHPEPDLDKVVIPD